MMLQWSRFLQSIQISERCVQKVSLWRIYSSGLVSTCRLIPFWRREGVDSNVDAKLHVGM